MYEITTIKLETEAGSDIQATSRGSDTINVLIEAGLKIYAG